jgi:predicted RNase H-like nuclease
MSDPVRVVGVDGWQKRWVAMVLVDGRFCRSFVAPSFEEVMAQAADARVVAVDMPIGLTDREPRACDQAARALLAGRSSPVFLTPPRSVLDLEDHAEACAHARGLIGKGISRQAHGLRRAILEVDPCAREDDRIVEAHPEVTFHTLASGPLPRKKSWAGQMERRRLLQRVGLRLPHDVGPASVAPADDVLDAAAMAWTAHRVAKGLARPLPDSPAQHDPQTGRRIAIWR